MEVYNELAEAIVIQAVEDYRRLMRVMKRRPASSRMLHEKAAYENFFTSEWFRTLCPLDPKYLMAEIRKEVS